MANSFEIIALTQAWPVDASIAAAAASAGAVGVLDLEWARDPGAARTALAALLAGSPGRVGIRVSPRSPGWADVLDGAPAGALDVVVIAAGGAGDLGPVLPRLRRAARRVLAEVRSVEEAGDAEAAAVDGVIAKGNESSGWVGMESTFILLQRLLARGRLPVFARGGVGLHSSAACLAAGAAGAILDGALLLARESPLDEAARSAIARADGTQAESLGDDLGCPVRLHARPASPAMRELRDVALQLTRSPSPIEERRATWMRTVEQRLDRRGPDLDPWPCGQDVAFAGPLAARYRTVAAIIQAVRGSAEEHCSLAKRLLPLREGSPLATSHGTRFPIVQGPMTRVSDVPGFAAEVARAGALPFQALALMRGDEVRTLLAQTHEALGSRPWGIGLLDALPEPMRLEQFAAVREQPPAYALVPGSRLDVVRELEAMGIKTYLHAPSMALLRHFFEQGLRRFAFQGREAGGHVLPLANSVFHDRVVDTLLELLPHGDGAAECHLLFAGGVHDARSAAMVAAMIAPLCARGARVGVQLGTSYFFTREAVTSGAIVREFQDEALKCRGTVLIRTRPDLLVRCAPTPFVEEFRATRDRLASEGRPESEISDALDLLGLGRARIASKGVRRTELPGSGERSLTPISPAQQHQEGLYIFGQLAALRSEVCTMDDLHRDISAGSGARLAELQERDEPRARPRPRGASTDVAIVGMGCVMPKAASANAFWDNIVHKVDAITEIPKTRWDIDLYFDETPKARNKIYSRWGGFIDPIRFDPVRHGIVPASLGSIEPVQLLVLEVVAAALRDAGYHERPFPRERTAVILGVSPSGDLQFRYALRAWEPVLGEAIDRAGPVPDWTEDTLPGGMPNVVAGRVANRFDLGGMNCAVDAACASSLTAVHMAVRELASHACDVAIAGAADMSQVPPIYMGFAAIGALSPDGRCRTFDHRANGIVTGEGVGALVLKRAEDAERDGDRIYAIIKGVAASSDGRALDLTAPRPDGQVRALSRAYEASGVSPSTVGLVEAHGTGTVVGDPAEIEALRKVYEKEGATRQSCAIGSVKSMIGHTKCAAGLASMIKAALALHHKVLPPTLHVEKPNPAAHIAESPFYPNVEPRPWMAPAGGGPRRAAVSAFGFGGTNFHAVLEEAPPQARAGAADPVVQAWPAELVVLRAKSVEELVGRMVAVERAFAGGAQPTLAELSHAASATEGPVSLALVAPTLDELRLRLAHARQEITRGVARLRDPRGIYFAREPMASRQPGRIAFLFPGQGSQYVEMGRELSVHFGEVRAAVERADEVLSGDLPRPLSSYVFSPPSFDDAAARRACAEALAATEIAQPALGAISVGMARLLEALGLRPEMVGGHSYGEYSALWAASSFPEDALYRLSHARGRCLRDAFPAGAPHGKMAAATAAPDAVVAALGEQAEVFVANCNGPRQTVIAGADDAVVAAVGALSARGIQAQLLPVSAAFHSPLVAGAQAPFADVLAKIQIAAPGMPVFSNVGGQVHPGGADSARILRDQLLQRVDFIAEIEAMYAAGARIFVEVGPRDALTGLVGQILDGRDVLAVPLDVPQRSGLVQLLHALGQLAAEGAPVRVDRLLRGRVARKATLETLDVACRPEPPPPSCFLVDGGRAWPLKGTAVARMPHPASPAPSAKPALAPPPRPALAPPVAAPLPTATAAEMLQRTAVAAGESDEVIVQWQQLMNRFLDTQRDVMLAYLSGSAPPLGLDRLHPAPALAAAPAPHAALPPAPGPSPSAPPPAPPPEPASEPPEPGPAAARAPQSRDEILASLSQLVSDKTGYPMEALQPDLKLDSDLGLGSVKRIEILSALPARLTLAPEVFEGRLQELTRATSLAALADAIVELLRGKATGGEPPLARYLLVPQQVPATVEELRPQGTILVTDDGNGVARALADELRGNGARAVILRHGAQAGAPEEGTVAVDLADGDAVSRAVGELRRRHGPIGGLFHLLPVAEGPRTEESWQARIAPEVKGLFHLVRAAASDLRDEAAPRFVVTATSAGVHRAEHACSPSAPIQGALAAIVKTVAREWPGVRCKAVDLEADGDPRARARLLLREAATNGPDVELCYRGTERLGLRPVESALPESDSGPTLDGSSVLLITGGARGITSEVAGELAARYKPTLLIVGRSPLPEVEPQETASLTNPQALRAFMTDRARGNGALNLAEIEQSCARILRERRMRASLEALQRTGAKIRYFSADVRDEAAFSRLIDDVYATYGRIDGVIHGAGIVEDKLIEDKSCDSFDRVFDTKVKSALTLVRKLRPESLKFLVFFSSVAGSFGNRGQVDYAAGNAFLSRLAAHLDREWPARVVSLAWGPWALETDIVTPEMNRFFVDRGFSLISSEAGRRAAEREIRCGAKGVSEVVLGSLGGIA